MSLCLTKALKIFCIRALVYKILQEILCKRAPCLQTFAKEPLFDKGGNFWWKSANSPRAPLGKAGRILLKADRHLCVTSCSSPKAKPSSSPKTQVQLCDKDGLPTWFCEDPRLLILILLYPKNNPKLTKSSGLHSVCLISLLKRSIGSFCSN